MGYEKINAQLKVFKKLNNLNNYSMFQNYLSRNKISLFHPSHLNLLPLQIFLQAIGLFFLNQFY